MRVAGEVLLTASQRSYLQRLTVSQSAAVRLVRRARIILMAGEGKSNLEISAALGVGRIQVACWRERFIAGGLDAIQADLPRTGRKVSIDADTIADLTTRALPAAAKQWSTRTLAEVAGVSDSTVQRVWKTRGIEPQAQDGRGASFATGLVERLEDLVGLYVSPTEHAIVFTSDPMGEGGVHQQTGALGKSDQSLHTSIGWKTMGAGLVMDALYSLERTFVKPASPSPSLVDWTEFLQQIGQQAHGDRALHMLCDNYTTHRQFDGKFGWMGGRAVRLHFTPHATGWFEAVERLLLERRLDRPHNGTFFSLSHLLQAINSRVLGSENAPLAFAWVSKNTNKIASDAAVL